MQKAIIMSLVLAITMVGGWFGASMIKAQLTGGEEPSSETQGQFAAYEVTVSGIKLRDTLLEVIPLNGTISKGTLSGPATNSPWWWEGADETYEVRVGTYALDLQVVNHSESTIAQGYWQVEAAGYHAGEGVWLRSPTAWISIPNPIPPGQKINARVTTYVHPDSTAARYTITYQEPGATAQTMTVEWPINR